MKNFIAYQIVRYYKYFKRILVDKIQIVKFKLLNSNNKLKVDYTNWWLNNNKNPKINYDADTSIVFEFNKQKNLKTIAFFLTQYYYNEVNNKKIKEAINE